MSLRDELTVRYRRVTDREKAFQAVFRDPLLARASRRIDDVVVFDGLQDLLARQTIREYQGFDPTKPDLHIGHLIPLLIHRDFQSAGHEVIFLIGGFTATIGDPSDKEKARTKMSEEEVERNAAGYREQVGRVLDFDHPTNPARVLNNRDWLASLPLREFVEMSSFFSWRDITNRDFIKKRIAAEEEIHFNELYYPLLQGYDSVAMKVNLEIGGSDQFYNMMVGRDMVRYIQHREKHVLTTPLLKSREGEKISKTGESVVVTLTCTPNDFFSGVMRLDDDMMMTGFLLLTDLDFDEVGELDEELRDAQGRGHTNRILAVKQRLAFEVTSIYHGETQAESAQRYFQAVFKGEVPPGLEILHVSPSKLTQGGVLLVDALAQTGITAKGASRRLIRQSGLRLNSEVVKDPNLVLTSEALSNGVVVQIGKSRFYRLELGE